MKKFEPVLLEEEKRIHAGWEGWCATILSTTGFGTYLGDSKVRSLAVQTNWVGVRDNTGPFLVLDVSRHAKILGLTCVQPHLVSVESKYEGEGEERRAYYRANYILFHVREDEPVKDKVSYVTIKYSEWLKSSAVMDHLHTTDSYAGYVDCCPTALKGYLDPTNTLPYCIIEVHKTKS